MRTVLRSDGGWKGRSECKMLAHGFGKVAEASYGSVGTLARIGRLDAAQHSSGTSHTDGQGRRDERQPAAQQRRISHESTSRLSNCRIQKGKHEGAMGVPDMKRDVYVAPSSVRTCCSRSIHPPPTLASTLRTLVPLRAPAEPAGRCCVAVPESG